MNNKKSFKKEVADLLLSKQVNIKAENFIYVEIILGIIYEMKISPKDGWILLTQYYKYLLRHTTIKNSCNDLYYLRKKCHHLANKLNWERILDEYFDIIPELRKFSYENNNLKKLNLKYLPNRNEEYIIFLNKIKDGKIIKPFIHSGGKTKYIRILRTNTSNKLNNNKIIKEFEINRSYTERDIKTLEKYREKKELFIPKNVSWKNIYDRMSYIWKDRPEFKIIDSNLNKNPEILYKEQIHIIGEVGQGKSNYKISEASRLVKEFDAKVGIIEVNVDDVIKTTKALREVGLKAVPVLGRSNLEKHAANYIQVASRNINLIGDIGDDEYKELEYLTGYCTVAAIAGDNEIVTREFPCKNILNDDEESKVCPLYSNCGYFKRFLDLYDADVWVATPYSLINTTIPKVVDPYERTFYEAFHDLLDIVIIDEADGVQRIFDSLFLNKEKLNGDNDDILTKFKELDEIIQKSNISNRESLAYTWQMNYKHISILIPKLTRMIANTQTLHSFLSREIITSFSLYSDIKEGFKIEQYPNNHNIVKKIDEYFEFTNTYDIEVDSIKHELCELYNELLWLHNVGKVEDESKLKIKELFQKYKVTIPIEKKKDLFYAKFELFLYLVQLDFYFKVLSRDYPVLMEQLSTGYEKINVYEGVRKSLRTFLTEAMTGTIFGYKFTPTDKGKQQKIDIFRYSGVGRKLLDNFHKLKEEINIKGPAVVVLSGTSVAPGSGHYDLLKFPEYIIKSFDNESKINQNINFKYDEEGNLIKVSGLNGEDRAKALRKITKELIRDIRLELRYWNNYKDVKSRNRKVLLIVNSYDNCIEVGNALNSSGLTYKVLSRKCKNENDYPKELLNNFAKESDNADILIAPLNVISRGYNILNEYNKSYFGSVFFLVRPYMVPDDLESYFQIINSNLEMYIQECKDKDLELGEAMKLIRKNSYTDLNNISQNKYWNDLEPVFRKNLAWFTLVPIKQTIGRLQRGGTDCRVFYCDGAFAPKYANNEIITRKNSMLGEWYDILLEGKNDIFIQELYGKFLIGIEEMIHESNERIMGGEDYE